MSYYSLINRNRCDYLNTKINILCVLILTILLTGQIKLSYAAPAHISEEKKSQITQENEPNIADSNAQWVKGRLLVTPRAGLSPKEFEKTLKHHGGKSKHHYNTLNFHVIELPDGVDEVKAMRALKKDRRLKDVELDMMIAPDLTITDPDFSRSWALPKIGAPVAWDDSNGDGVIVAILDTGVNGDHPDLAANMVPGWNTFDNNSDTADVHNHGTWVAGTVAAAANNGAGSAGVSWGSNIMPIRISDLDGFGYISTISAGIRWAADHGAKVVNISYGVAGSPTIQTAAAYMRSKGGVVMVSAGNSGSRLTHAPSDVLLVASATNRDDVRPSWSSYGDYVDISAPGVSIYTTTRSGGYGNVSGTSFSSPIVAATAALMLSANNDLSPADVDQIIMSTAVDLGATGYDEFYGAGRVDVGAAVAAAIATISIDNQSPSIAITSPANNSEISGIAAIDVDYSDNIGVVRVELFVDGQQLLTDSQVPFAFSWDTTTVTDGDYTLIAHAFDAAGNQGNSTAVLATIKNDVATDNEAPVIAITSPADGEVSGIVPVTLSYSDNIAVTHVDLYVDGQKIMTESQAPFSFSWDTSSMTDGSHTLAVKAFDAADNEGVSSAVTVTVNNTPIDDTVDPTITSFNLTDGMKVSRRQLISVSASDNQGVTQIILTINGKEAAVSQSDSLRYNWSTRTRGKYKNIDHIVTVTASDQAGNTASKSVSVHTR